MSDDVNDGPKDDGPGGGFVEGDVLVERDDVVQGCLAQQGYEVPANREQNEGYIDVKNEGGGTSKDETIPEHSPRIVRVVIQSIHNETQAENEEVEENPDKKEQTTTTLVYHPDIPPIQESGRLVRPFLSGTIDIRPLEGLQTPPFGLVSLEVAGLGGSVGIVFLEVWVLVQIGDLPAVSKIEAGRPLELVVVCSHRNGCGRGWWRPALALRFAALEPSLR